MGSIGSVLTVAVVFAALYGVIQLFVRRKERIIAVEKGTGLPDMGSKGPSFSTLKCGIFLIGIGLGVLTASILTSTTKMDSEVAYFSMIFLFGGISLIIAHLVERKKSEK